MSGGDLNESLRDVLLVFLAMNLGWVKGLGCQTGAIAAGPWHIAGAGFQALQWGGVSVGF